MQIGVMNDFASPGWNHLKNTNFKQWQKVRIAS